MESHSHQHYYGAQYYSIEHNLNTQQRNNRQITSCLPNPAAINTQPQYQQQGETGQQATTSYANPAFAYHFEGTSDGPFASQSPQFSFSVQPPAPTQGLRLFPHKSDVEGLAQKLRRTVTPGQVDAIWAHFWSLPPAMLSAAMARRVDPVNVLCRLTARRIVSQHSKSTPQLPAAYPQHSAGTPQQHVHYDELYPGKDATTSPSQQTGGSYKSPLVLEDDTVPPATVPHSTSNPKPNSIEVTDLIYAKGDIPKAGDLIYDAFFTMRWMGKFKGVFQFDQKARSHRWFVRGDDPKAFHCIRSNDGLKKFGWQLDAQLEALETLKGKPGLGQIMEPQRKPKAADRAVAKQKRIAKRATEKLQKAAEKANRKKDEKKQKEAEREQKKNRGARPKAKAQQHLKRKAFDADADADDDDNGATPHKKVRLDIEEPSPYDLEEVDEAALAALCEEMMDDDDDDLEALAASCEEMMEADEPSATGSGEKVNEEASMNVEHGLESEESEEE